MLFHDIDQGTEPMPRNPTIQTGRLVDKDRLREALRQIRESGSRGITRRELCERLGGVSLRLVERAISLLEAQGARIERTRSEHSTVLRYSLSQGPTWDEHLTPETGLALRLAGLALTQSGTALWGEKLEVLEALIADTMSAKDLRVFEQLRQAILVSGGVIDPVECLDGLEPLLRAMAGPYELEVEYQARRANLPAPLRVVPYRLVHDLFSGGVFMLAWDPAARLPKHLRLSRMHHLKVTRRPGLIGDPQAMADAAHYQIGGWISKEPPFQVVARIESADWARTLEEAPPLLPDYQAEASADRNTLLVRFKANHEHGATRWLLQFGNKIEVLEPPWLRAAVGGQLREAAARYFGAGMPN